MRIFPCIFPCYLRGEWFARDWFLRQPVLALFSLSGLRREISILRPKWPNFYAVQRLRFLWLARRRANRAVFLRNSSSSAFSRNIRNHRSEIFPYRQTIRETLDALGVSRSLVYKTLANRIQTDAAIAAS